MKSVFCEVHVRSTELRLFKLQEYLGATDEGQRTELRQVPHTLYFRRASNKDAVRLLRKYQQHWRRTQTHLTNTYLYNKQLHSRPTVQKNTAMT